MSEPKDQDWGALKRLARYLMDKIRVIIKFGYHGEVSQLIMWAETDFAGCARTRKSTSGGVVQFGNHFVKSSSSTQGLGAMSSGKADCYGIVKGASMGLGIKIVLSVLGVAVNAIIRMDASATKGIANRKGLGKVRHIQLNQLWIQDRVVKGEIIVLKVKGKENLANLLTKHCNATDIKFHMVKTNRVVA